MGITAITLSIYNAHTSGGNVITQDLRVVGESPSDRFSDGRYTLESKIMWVIFLCLAFSAIFTSGPAQPLLAFFSFLALVFTGLSVRHPVAFTLPCRREEFIAKDSSPQ